MNTLELGLGYLEGELCNRYNCKGIIEQSREGSCSCHISPPCSYCTDGSHYCPVCNWDYETELLKKGKVKSVSVLVANPKPKIDKYADDGNLYSVIRYFDTYPDGILVKNLTKSKAHEFSCKQEKKHKTSYEVRHASDVF